MKKAFRDCGHIQQPTDDDHDSSLSCKMMMVMFLLNQPRLDSQTGHQMVTLKCTNLKKKSQNPFIFKCNIKDFSSLETLHKSIIDVILDLTSPILTDFLALKSTEILIFFEETLVFSVPLRPQIPQNCRKIRTELGKIACFSELVF